MMRRLYLLLPLLAAFAPTAAAQYAQATSEDYAVYRAALQAEPWRRLLPTSSAPIVVDRETYPLVAEVVFFHQPMRVREGIDSSTVDAMRDMHGEPGRLSADSLGLPRSVEISAEANDSLFASADTTVRGWDRFHARFGAGARTLSLSRVAFNRDHTQAIVDVTERCEGRCGHAETLLLDQKDGHWVVARQIVVMSY